MTLTNPISIFLDARRVTRGGAELIAMKEDITVTTQKLKKILFYTSFCIAMLLAVTACTPRAALDPQPGQAPVSEPATPTPEVFNPLSPSPTPSGSALPLTCQVTDLNTYVSEEWGYCLAFPLNFSLDESQAAAGVISLYGPPLSGSDPLRASVEISAQPVPAGSDLLRLAEAYAATFRDLPITIEREPLTLAGVPAQKLEPVPGLLSSSVVLALHNDVLLTLRFHPVDAAAVKPDLEAAMQTVTGSFAFLPEAATPQALKRSLGWSEFGQTISLSYDASLAPWAEVETIPAVPVSDQIIFAEQRPAYVRFRFDGYQGGRVYELPLLPFENVVAQVMVFQTQDFSGYGNDKPNGFIPQQQALAALLDAGLHPERCAQPYTEISRAMPFLPWLNSLQVFCAHPQILEFPGGRGVRYLTFYSQGPNPVLDRQVFYTFQGMTNDGKFYISAVFPVQTGIFPNDPPPCPKCGQPDYDLFAALAEEMKGQLIQLNALPDDKFAPQLAVLDEIIQSLRIDEISQ